MGKGALPLPQQIFQIIVGAQHAAPLQILNKETLLKTYKHLYPRITEFENLYLAFKSAARGKRSRHDVAAFEFDLERNLLELQDELQRQTYKTGGYHNFLIHDPKPRLISAAPFRDRVAHHALCRVIEPIFEKRFIHDSYACRVGKGTHAALNRAQEFAKRYPYVLKCDLRHFFPSMDHQILRGQLARLIADPQTMWLASQIIQSGDGIHPDEEQTSQPQTSEVSKTSEVLQAEVLRAHGLPIGNLTSQFWANVYLDPLDQFVKRKLKCEGYVRYVDDFLLFADDKRDLHRWKKSIIEFAASLRLKLHERESVVFPVTTGIPFLGWREYPDHRRLKQRNGLAFQRRFKRLLFSFSNSKIKWKDVDASVQSWVAHAAHGQTYGLRRALLGGVILPRAA